MRPRLTAHLIQHRTALVSSVRAPFRWITRLQSAAPPRPSRSSNIHGNASPQHCLWRVQPSAPRPTRRGCLAEARRRGGRVHTHQPMASGHAAAGHAHHTLAASSFGAPPSPLSALSCTAAVPAPAVFWERFLRGLNPILTAAAAGSGSMMALMGMSPPTRCIIGCPSSPVDANNETWFAVGGHHRLPCSLTKRLLSRGLQGAEVAVFGAMAALQRQLQTTTGAR